MMRDLIEMRKRIVSGTLPADELSRISHQVADMVDYGNRLLDLDLNLRNQDNCQPADIRSLSAVQVFEMVRLAWLDRLFCSAFFADSCGIKNLVLRVDSFLFEISTYIYLSTYDW